MKKLLLLFLALCIPVNTFALSDSEKRLELIFQEMNILDFASTSKILHQGGKELSPLMGEHPNDLELAGWCIATGAFHYWIATQFPREYDVLGHTIPLREWWQKGSIVAKTGVVGWNFTVVKW